MHYIINKFFLKFNKQIINIISNLQLYNNSIICKINLQKDIFSISIILSNY